MLALSISCSTLVNVFTWESFRTPLVSTLISHISNHIPLADSANLSLTLKHLLDKPIPTVLNKVDQPRNRLRCQTD